MELYLELLGEAAKRRSSRGGVAAPSNPREIRLTNVSLIYPGQKTPALRDVTVSIKRGEVIALVGENGSGKTTLAKVITGLNPASEGTVRWDDVALAEADHTSVHEQTAVIAQDPARWPMTARHNVTVGRPDQLDVDDSRWRNALSKSGADEVIEALPQGNQTLLSRQFNDGQDLLGGQWQRLGIARGIFRDGNVLVADEPTAALDAKAEARVFAGLQHAARTDGNGEGHPPDDHPGHAPVGRAACGSHPGALHEGGAVESGTHPELMARGDRYAELFGIQVAQYRHAPDVGHAARC